MSKFSHGSGNAYGDEGYISFQEDAERRIVLIGKTGARKSDFGNIILGMEHFDARKTKVCKIGRCKTKEGKEILVLNTPDLSRTKLPNKETLEELCKYKAITAPGPHVICLLIYCSKRFTSECFNLDELCSFLGEEIYKHLIVVFTNGSCYEGHNCFSNLPETFKKKFLTYGGNKLFVELDNIGKREGKTLIKNFFTLMEEIIRRNKAKEELEAYKEFLTLEHKKREQELIEKNKYQKEKIKYLKGKLEEERKTRVKDVEDYIKKLWDFLENAQNVILKK